MLSLAIHHNIWLTRDQRYAVHNGIELVVVGLSVPVWVANNKVSSEPAKEIFCKYYLKNPKAEMPIQIVSNGYEITLPNRIGSLPNLSDDEWRYLSFNHPVKLDNLYQKCSRDANSKCLLDLKDGGSKCLKFREHNKVKRNEEFVNFIHFVNIADMSELTNSLV